MKTRLTSDLTKEKLLDVLLMGQPPDIHMKNLQMIHDMCYKTDTKVAHKKFYNEKVANGDPFAPIDPMLEEFIGSYFVESIEIPPWFKVFSNDVTIWICDMLELHNPAINEEIGNFEGDETTLSKQAKKIIDTIKHLNHITPKSFDEGKFNDGKKIIKSLISAIEVGIGNKELAPEKTSWYKSYEANKLQGGGKQIVITNSKVAKIGLSSLFSGYSASSCQKLTAEKIGKRSMNDALYNNVADENMVIMYEPGESLALYPIKDVKGADKFSSMKWRTILRLIDIPDNYKECNNCDAKVLYDTEICKCGNKSFTEIKTQKVSFRKAIMMDTFYPSANDIMSAFAVVKEIADQLGIAVVVSDRSHYSQTGSSCRVEMSKGPSYFGSYGKIKAMSSTEDCSICKNSSTKDACSYCVPFNTKLCEVCKEKDLHKSVEVKKCTNCKYNKMCTILDCTECPYADCHTFYPRAPYFDQLSGTEKFHLCKDKTIHMMDVFYELKNVQRK